jgi:hypothetical protein
MRDLVSRGLAGRVRGRRDHALPSRTDKARALPSFRVFCVILPMISRNYSSLDFAPFISKRAMAD